MRAGAGSGDALNLARKQLKTIKTLGLRHLRLPILIILGTIILTLIQATSIVLISDIGLSRVPGDVSTVPINFGFNYYDSKGIETDPPITSRGTAWNWKPALYSTFAEYSEPPFTQEGVSDTGLTLRAFLPFGSAQTRGPIRSYAGKSTVLDARVTCQVPALHGAVLQMPYFGAHLIFNASVSASRYIRLALQMRQPFLPLSEASWALLMS
jgi:hypothetical protein